jgi:hypothetical protein
MQTTSTLFSCNETQSSNRDLQGKSSFTQIYPKVKLHQYGSENNPLCFIYTQVKLVIFPSNGFLSKMDLGGKNGKPHRDFGRLLMWCLFQLSKLQLNFTLKWEHVRTTVEIENKLNPKPSTLNKSQLTLNWELCWQ